MEIAKLSTRSFDTTFSAHWSGDGRPPGLRSSPSALSFPNYPIYLLCFYPGNDRSDDKLLASPEGVQVGAATGIAPGHAATHRHQILARISLHGEIRRHRTSIALIVDMKNRSGDGVVGKAGNRIRKSIASRPVHRRGMNTAVELAAEILCQPPRADRSHAMSHHVDL